MLCDTISAATILVLILLMRSAVGSLLMGFLALLLLLGCLQSLPGGVGTYDRSKSAKPGAYAGPLGGRLNTLIPPLYNEYCNSDTGGITGTEGSVDESRFRLRGLVLVTRHGDRSAIYSVQDPSARVPPDCGVRSSGSAALFDNYRQFILSEKADQLFRLDGTKFPPEMRIPHEKECRAGMLTAVGTTQMIRLGLYLRGKYRSSFLFSRQDPLFNVSIASTNYPRTFQSGLALSYGLFLDQQGLRAEPIPFYVSQTTHFCMDSWCSCPRLNDFRYQFEADKGTYFMNMAPDPLKKTVVKIAQEILNVPDLIDPLQLFDSLACTFVCRGSALPCKDQLCVTWSDMKTIADFVWTRSAHLRSVESLRKMTAVENLPIYATVSMIIERLKVSDQASEAYFRYFSAHDVTIRAVLRGLDIFDGEVPHYASRIVMEIYQDKEDTKNAVQLYFRVVHNGIDRTEQLKFCKNLLRSGDGVLCSVEDFLWFLQNDLLALSGTKSMQELCFQ